MKMLYVTPLWSGFKDVLLFGSADAKGMPAFIQPLRYFKQRGHQIDFVIANRSFPQDHLNINVDWLQDSRFYFLDWNLSFFRRLLAPFLLYKKIQRVLKKQKYDFIYGHGSLGAIANIAANKNSIPCGIRLYGTFLASEISRYSSVRIFARHPLEYLSFKLKKEFLLITNDGTRGDEVYSYLVQNKGTYKFYFWLNGVENVVCADENNLANANIVRPYLIYPARISRWKRQHLAVELLHMLKKKGLKLHLYFIGHIFDKEYWDEVNDRVTELKINELTHYLGTVNPTRLCKLARNAAAVLSFYEYSNLGNVVIEALSSGALVLSLRDGSLRNIIDDGKNGILVDDIAQAAERISALIESPALSEEIKRKAKVRASEIFPTWNQRAEEEMQLITNSVENSKNF